jgi:flagellar biosynthesis GTPase FlhF
MDIAQIPKSKGWTVEQWMYYFDTLGIAFVNSAEEGREGDPSSVSKFNQFTGIDMTLSNSINGYFSMLSKIEEAVENITGISRQRKGQINSSETVGGVERAVVQSNALTEIYFHEHSMVKEKVLEHLLEIAKIAYSTNEHGKLVFDEFSRTVLNTKSLLNTDFGLYVSDSIKDNAILEQLKGLAKEGISSGTLQFSNFVTLLKSNSIAEVESSIKQSEERKMKLQEQQSQIQQQQIQSNETLAREKMDRDENQKQLDREARLREAEIRALGNIGMSNPDVNQNAIPDVMEATKLSLQQSKQQFEQVEKQQKMEIEKTKMQMQQEMQARENAQQDRVHADNMRLEQQKLALKKEEIAVKKKALKYKPKSK